MSDLVDRQAAVDVLIALGDWYKDNNARRVVHQCICALYDDVPSAQPVQRWIPVSERLPDSGEIVLVNCTPIAPYRIILVTSDDVKKYADVGAIDAWMPLPEPYGGM